MEEKNYYDWLEISRNASPEVVEKAYKTLVKKYHPDLQEGENKQQAEEMIKKINEAYSVLSDETKRKQYDETIKESTISREDYDRLQQELNNMSKQSTTNDNHNTNHVTNMQPTENEKPEQNIEYQQQLENARKKAYYDAYIQDLKRRGYKIRYKKTFKDYLKIFIVIVVVIVLCILLWVIPFTREKLIDFYNSNEIIKWMIDMVINIFKSIFNIN